MNVAVQALCHVWLAGAVAIRLVGKRALPARVVLVVQP